MLKVVSGDILLSRCQVIAHGVAPNDHFNQGLALRLRERYPAMAKDFRHYCRVASPKPGDVWAWVGADGRRIVNLLTQEPPESAASHPGRASTHNVNVALRNLKKLIEEEHFESVALPKLATGVGGLNWEEVEPLIESHLGDLAIPVVLYTSYIEGRAAED